MPNWIPKPEWKEQAAFLIGGGSSLRGFDFSLLKGKNTIGCNQAFRLGPEVVQYCLFGDSGFWQKNQVDLSKFPGKVVTCTPVLQSKPVPWLLQMRRIRDGLHEGNILGWNYSTGAAAINLAVSLGAHRIYLLGYDLGVLPETTPPGKLSSHWHTHYPNITKDYAFQRFLRGFNTVAASLKQHYPHVEVINVTDGSSKLDVFPKISQSALLSVLKEGS